MRANPLSVFRPAELHLMCVVVVAFLVVFLWNTAAVKSMWKDSTQYENGRYAVLRLTKAILFLLGVVYVATAYLLELLVAVGFDVAKIDAGNGFALIGLGIGAQAVKEGADKVGEYLDRKTKDDNNNALAVPPSLVPPGDVPPPLMKQTPNPTII